MPLLNVYQYLNAVKPHIAYRFNCDIWPYRSDNNNREDVDPQYRRRTYAVKKISQPVFKFDLENKKYFGNTQFIIPILKFSESELEITFEETDDMEIYKFLAERYSESPFMRSSISGLVNIEITQFDETMKNIVDKKHYIAMLKSFDTPTFNNNGYGSPLEISAVFNILYIFDGRIEEEGIDNKIGLKYNSNTQKLERNPITALDFTDHLNRAKKAEPGIDKEIKTAQHSSTKVELKKNPEDDARKREIRQEQANIRNAEIEAVSTVYNNIFNNLSTEEKREMTEKAIDEYTRQNKGKKRDTAYDAFNTDKGLFIAKYLDNVNAADGLTTDELSTIKANLVQMGTDEKTADTFISALSVYEEKYDEYEKEYNTINKVGLSNLPKKVSKFETAKTNDVMADGNGNALTITDIKTSGKNKILIVEDNKHETTTFELPMSIVFHNQAATRMSMSMAISNSASNGVTGTADETGNLVFDTKRLYEGNKSSAAKGTNSNKNNENAVRAVALELVGAVAVVESEEGKYYVRQAGSGQKGVDYIEISQEEFNRRKGQQYTAETMENDKQLVMNYEHGISGTKKAIASDGSNTTMKIKNMYSEAITDGSLNAAYLFGSTIRSEAEKEAKRTGKTVNDFITDEYINSISGYSHGMLDVTSGKMEGTPDDVRQLLNAVKQGLRGNSQLNKEETVKARRH